MVKLSDAAAYPEAMVVEFADATIALPAMPATEGLYYLASFTESSLGQLNLIHYIQITI